ncbi:bifunctional phosphoribosyl-AMP cyclohydrolase/phosphoribosyl-ATP diphosphatase HisIE [Flavobacterium rakeshii]|uniref:bifunctional phosphoribosyl-AMP cyclohydrolase/phosphoribosyl-ATP diphosphatase HisIE n=1 Tax=Flavobacterium rakeshii TaxID=1038845 RepID=UPI002E7B2147|nr:bifunctional phosphoribosyl-AMP cyclohydrolase/phosphoribosyl-ATP diphosphatase HisIE [Flavobacterium rakeshii]MEE1898541.1 bifunctional phosphoribosyl-AMP cyclohydrolase/phosphoribosyl-ATP diphosphatase HisIE [Flavobacterium rakeshii]
MKPDFNKTNGLIPVIIQNATTQQVLMLGYMNEEAFTKTKLEKRVTFYSRSRNELWTKGETSGNYLNVVSMSLDCDNDTILIQAKPAGPTCHTGTTTCFGEPNSKGFLYQLEEMISERIESDSDTSYTNTLFKRGINKVAQKVGEEAVELIIEAKDDNEELFKNEAADLLYHFLILLKAKSLNLTDIEKVLEARSK